MSNFEVLVQGVKMSDFEVLRRGERYWGVLSKCRILRTWGEGCWGEVIKCQTMRCWNKDC